LKLGEPEAQVPMQEEAQQSPPALDARAPLDRLVSVDDARLHDDVRKL
jgi:hypothetical protein